MSLSWPMVAVGCPAWGPGNSVRYPAWGPGNWAYSLKCSRLLEYNPWSLGLRPPRTRRFAP